MDLSGLGFSWLIVLVPGVSDVKNTVDLSAKAVLLQCLKNSRLLIYRFREFQHVTPAYDPISNFVYAMPTILAFPDSTMYCKAHGERQRHFTRVRCRDFLLHPRLLHENVRHV